MKLDKCIQIFVAATLALPVAVFGQAGANPFGAAPKTSVVAVDMTKAEALAALSGSDKAKVHPDHLTKLLDRVPKTAETKADLIIVEYTQNLITGLPSNKKLSNKELDDNQKRSTAEFKKIKQNVHGKFDITEIEVIQDYEVFPMSVISIKDKKSLVKLLKDPTLKRISKNNVGVAHLTESLPQIGQPPAQIAGFTGAGTSVVVLDSGLDYTRPAFGSCISPGVPQSTCKVVAVGDFAADDGALDAHPKKHGTNVSGIVVGVAPSTKLIGIDIFTGNSFYYSDLFNGYSVVNNK